jgi:NAD(P)-dependent dehydrogenase (short-subunit alcohol dehydrogenase family)
VGKLDGRVAVVTSSTRGLGRAIAEAFVREGARVVINGRSEGKGRAALEEMGAGDAVRFVAGDAMVREDCERVVDAAIAEFGRIDVLVNNAGGAQDAAPVAEMSDEAMRIAMDWCFWSTFWCTRRALGDMIPRRSGRIINISSLEGKCGKPITSGYVAAKHAVNGFTKSCAAEVGPLGITVNALCPGAMDTDIMREVGAQIADQRGIAYEEFLGIFSAEAATKRITEIPDVAAVAVLVASDAGSGITGSLLSIDGGTAPY